MSADGTRAFVYHSVHPILRLRQWLRLESEDARVVVIYTAATELISLIVPIAVQAVVNMISFGTLLQPLAVLTLMVLIALLAVAWLNGYRQYVVEMIQRRIFVRLAGDVADKLVCLEPEAFDRHHGPELVNRFLEVVTVQTAGAALLLDGLTVAVQTLIGMILRDTGADGLLPRARPLRVRDRRGDEPPTKAVRRRRRPYRASLPS